MELTCENFEQNPEGVFLGPLYRVDHVFIDLIDLITGEDDLELYKKFCTRFSGYLALEDYDTIYQRGMIEHIEWTERYVPFMGDSHPTLHDLIELSLTEEVDYYLSVDDTARYADWLISNGRARRLKSHMIVSLLRQLIFSEDEVYDIITAKQLLWTLHLSPHLADICKKLFDFIGRTDHTEESLDAIFKCLSETGILAKAACRAQILVMHVPGRFIQEYVDEVHRLSYQPPTPGSADESLRMSFNLLADIKNIDQTELFAFLTKRAGDLAYYGSVILSYLLDFANQVGGNFGNPKVKSHEDLIIRIIGQGIFVTKNIYNYYMIVSCATKNILAMFYDGNVTQSHAMEHFLMSTMLNKNTILYGGACERIDYLTFLFADNFDLQVFRFLTIRFPHEKMLHVFQQLLDNDEGELLDQYFSNTIPYGDPRVLDLIQDNIEYAGCLTMKSLMSHIQLYGRSPNQDLLFDHLITFTRQHQQYYVDTVVTNLATRNSNRIIFTLDPLNGGIFYRSHQLIMGSRTYTYTNSHTELRYRELTGKITSQVECSECESLLDTIDGEIYKDITSSHGIYICENCVEHDSPTIARVSCSVCLSDDEDLKMQIASCGHSFCTQCLMTLESRADHHCPMCRVPMIYQTVSSTCTPDQAKEFFWAEWRADPETARLLARQRSDFLSTGDHDTDSDDDSDR